MDTLDIQIHEKKRPIELDLNSLSTKQMSNEGLASSVEGLNISQVSNEGMATSAIIDAGEFTAATSPVW